MQKDKRIWELYQYNSQAELVLCQDRNIERLLDLQEQYSEFAEVQGIDSFYGVRLAMEIQA